MTGRVVFSGRSELASVCQKIFAELGAAEGVEWVQVDGIETLYQDPLNDKGSKRTLLLLEASGSVEWDRVLPLVHAENPLIVLYSEETRTVAAKALAQGAQFVLPLSNGLPEAQVLEAAMNSVLSVNSGCENAYERTSDQLTVLRQAQQIAKLGFWEYDQIQDRLTWSDEVYRIFELNVNEEPATFEGFLKYVHPDDREMIIEAYERHLENGLPYELEHRVITSKGNRLYVQERCESVRNPLTGGWHSLGVVHDISELHLLTELMELLVETANAFINLPNEKFDAEIQNSLHRLGTFVQADRFFVFSYDFEKQTASNTHEWCSEGIEPMIQYLQNSDIHELDLWLDHHLNGKIMRVPDVQALDPDDPLRHILEPQGIKTLISMPLMDGEECTGFIGLDYVRNYHDLTAWEEKLLVLFSRMLVNAQSRFKLLGEISENRDFLDALFENSPFVFYIKDASGKYLRVNRQGFLLSGMSPEEVIGKSDAEIFPEGPPPRVLFSGEENDGIHHKEETVTLKTGTRSFFTVEFPVKQTGSSANVTVGISTDITERKQMEALQLKRERAEAANREKDLFLAKMSHEIRTPLNTILGFSRMLARELTSLPDVAEKFRLVQRCAEHLNSMVADMLEHSRLGSGRMELVPIEFNLLWFLQELADFHKAHVEDSGLTFVFMADPELEVSVHTDQNKLRQILTNLLSNAVKFTNEGLIALRATCETSEPERILVRFEVEDSGCGIPSGETEHLFKEYYQGQSGKRFGGTGLGLTIANHLAGLLGSEGIQLVRNTEKGCLFAVRLSLPLAVNARSDNKAPAQCGKTPPPPNSSRATCFSLSTLTDTHRNTLCHLVEEGDMTEFRRAMKQTSGIDELTRQYLLFLAAKYDYPALLRALQPPQEEKE